MAFLQCFLNIAVMCAIIANYALQTLRASERVRFVVGHRDLVLETGRSVQSVASQALLPDVCKQMSLADS